MSSTSRSSRCCGNGYPEAEVWFRKALDQLRRLEAQGKLPPAKKEWLTTVEKELNALPR